MASLTTAITISTDAKRTKGVIIDSVNDFKSEISCGVLFNTLNISAAWVDLVLKNQPKAVALFSEYVQRHPYLNDYYVISSDQQSITVTERGSDALTLDNHLSYLRSMEILDYQNLFSSKPDNKPLDYRQNSGWLIISKI